MEEGSKMKRYIDSDKRSIKSIENERSKKKYKKAIALAVVFVISTASLLLVEHSYINNSGSSNSIGQSYLNNSESSSLPFATIIGNLSNPSPRENFPYGYVSPVMWGFSSGEGNVKISMFSNSSIHLYADLYGRVSAFGYPSEHFTYQLPMNITTAIKEKLSSFVSYNVVRRNMVENDMIFDFFLGSNFTTQPQYEVEVFLLNNLYGNPFNYSKNLTLVNMPIIIDGKLQNVEWDTYVGKSASGGVPDYVFMPDINQSNNANFEVSLYPFLTFLVNHKYIPPTINIVRLGIGSEFMGSSTIKSGGDVIYSFWMYSYFLLNGKKYQIVQQGDN